MMIIVWVCGRFHEDGRPWEIMGIFTWKRDAIKTCVQSSDFIGPVELNKKLPQEIITWSECYYPLKKS